MSEFALYLRMGYHHIASIGAWDHILFVAALTAAYGIHEWKRIAVLVTAFTLGHSITLALATFDIVRASPRVVEPLIAATIVFMAFAAIGDQLVPPTEASRTAAMRRRYATAGIFGLIHGLGFASALHALLGAEQSIGVPLFAFNVGLEVGQLLIVSVFFALGVAVDRWLHVRRRDWVLILSGAAAGIGLTLLIDRLGNAA
ncbi:MAG: HupE/UreJ family protein [Gemmatimonadaceae bacterium]|nr:HupE/UreJ family protein [Gemmatimonadaceae bacterium]